MRITMNQLNRSMQYVLNNRYSDLCNLQEQLATGKRLMRPSDDPVDVANALKLETKLREYQQFKKNINDGLAFMNVTGTAMESMNTLLQRARELAIQASSDTIGDTERQYINKETEQLLRQMVALIDTKYKGDYVFSGNQTKIPPLQYISSVSNTVEDYTNYRMAYFDSSAVALGSTVQIFNGFDDTPVKNIIPGTFELQIADTSFVEGVDYEVDYLAGTLTILSPDLLLDVTPGTPAYDISQVKLKFDSLSPGKDIYGSPISSWGTIERTIESSITMQINITADELTTDFNSGNNLIDTMIRFGQNLLRSDHAGIESAIEEIDYAFNAILAAQSKNGARINRFETTLVRNENQFTETTALQSELVDAEMAETISKFLLTENIYNAALKASSRLIQPSLVNYL
ncbi:MAG: flagellar hook-associated protein FlgL [Fibrobacter sp.]|jgi:flagellar hook-associated protein 3 FlgL|nr:flagellar hook-associated protein FlgL [Fibrobacter sp.]